MLPQALTHSFIRSVPFVIEILAANMIFLHKFEKKREFAFRYTCMAVLLTICTAFIFYCTGGTLLNNILSFVFSLCFLLLSSRICFNISWSDAAFCATAGYNVQFIASTLSELPQRLFSVPRYPIEIPTTVVIYIVMYMVYGKKIAPGQNLNLKRFSQYTLLTTVVMIDIVLCACIRPYWRDPQQKTLIICSMVPLLVSALTTLALQFTLLSRKSFSDELMVVEQLRKKEEEQYRLSKDTIDSINLKCHDMRHQIREIGTQAHMSPEAMHEITDTIQIYDSMYKTGNQALDTILNEKMLFCQNKSISINCMADGKKLSFMSDSDIYSLFGNMIENAINAVQELPEGTRDIYLSVSGKGELLSILCENPCHGEIIFNDGLPVTKNTDTFNHGIGVRSIQLTVAKYGGTVHFEAKDGVFYVDILFTM